MTATATVTAGTLPRPVHFKALLASLAVMYATGMAFLAVQESGDYGIWAPLSDGASALFAAAVFPLAIAVGRELFAQGQEGARAWGLVGAAGAVLIAVASLGLVVGDSGLLQTPSWVLGVQFLGFAVVGLWLLAVGVMALRSGTWSKVARWAAVAGGAGQAVGMVFTALGMYESPIFGVAMLANVVGIVTWAVSRLRAAR